MVPYDNQQILHRERDGTLWVRAWWDETTGGEVRRLDDVVAGRRVDRSDDCDKWKNQN